MDAAIMVSERSASNEEPMVMCRMMTLMAMGDYCTMMNAMVDALLASIANSKDHGCLSAEISMTSGWLQSNNVEDHGDICCYTLKALRMTMKDHTKENVAECLLGSKHLTTCCY